MKAEWIGTMQGEPLSVLMQQENDAAIEHVLHIAKTKGIDAAKIAAAKLILNMDCVDTLSNMMLCMQQQQFTRSLLEDSDPFLDRDDAEEALRCGITNHERKPS